RSASQPASAKKAGAAEIRGFDDLAVDDLLVLDELVLPGVAHGLLLVRVAVRGLPRLHVLGFLGAEDGEHLAKRRGLDAGGDGVPGTARQVQLVAAELLQRVDSRVLVDPLPERSALGGAHVGNAELDRDDGGRAGTAGA